MSPRANVFACTTSPEKLRKPIRSFNLALKAIPTQNPTARLSEATDTLEIDFERLKGNLEALSDIGRREDRGLYRMAFTDADMRARDWLAERLQEAGIDTWMDGAANLFGRLTRPEIDDRPAILIGSHTDTVPGAGHLDGALGVIAGLECLLRLKDLAVPLERPVEMVSFSDEEGRFGGLLGSQALCGELTPERIHSAADLSNVSLIKAMGRHGLDAYAALDARRAPEEIEAYLELHIEQGPVLDKKGINVGLVENITGLFKWTARLIGEADHAGTTPMPMRHDAFAGLAEFTGEIPRILEEHGSDSSVATIGRVELSPGSANTVPGRVEFSLDVRDTSQPILDDLGDAIRRALSAIGRRRGLMFEFDVVSEVAPVSCDANFVNYAEKEAERLGLTSLRMSSGAAHDAQIMARLARIGLIFVPSKDGRSHSPAEWSHWQDIRAGANVLFGMARRLASSNEQ
jgi:N-carbamoyl-L-amino-acid hydrolase